MIPVPGDVPDPTAPALLHVGDRTVPLPLPEAGGPGAILFPGADIWIEGASEDWIAVGLMTFLRAQVREADDRTARQIPRRRTA